MPNLFWTVTPEWQGETAFIIAGGTSVLDQNLDLLRGRRVIALNSSYEAAPFADFLLFMDRRWWYANQAKPALAAFKGRLVSLSVEVVGARLLKLKRCTPPPALVTARDSAVCSRTCLQAALNLVVHLGAPRIVLLGADMARGADGRSHHHAPHEWGNKKGNATWDVQLEQLALTVEPLREMGIEVVNTSPISRIGWWRHRKLEECLGPRIR